MHLTQQILLFVAIVAVFLLFRMPRAKEDFALVSRQPLFVLSPNATKNCPTGYRRANPTEAETHRDVACKMLDQHESVRLDKMGSMDGPGMSCTVRKRDTRSTLSQKLCILESQ